MFDVVLLVCCNSTCSNIMCIACKDEKHLSFSCFVKLDDILIKKTDKEFSLRVNTDPCGFKIIMVHKVCLSSCSQISISTCDTTSSIIMGKFLALLALLCSLTHSFPPLTQHSPSCSQQSWRSLPPVPTSLLFLLIPGDSPTHSHTVTTRLI